MVYPFGDFNNKRNNLKTIQETPEYLKENSRQKIKNNNSNNNNNI